MNKIKNLNKTKRGKQKEKRKRKRKTRKLFKGGGECKGPMCTICQECLTVRDDPKYSKYFDMLEDKDYDEFNLIRIIRKFQIMMYYYLLILTPRFYIFFYYSLVKQHKPNEPMY